MENATFRKWLAEHGCRFDTEPPLIKLMKQANATYDGVRVNIDNTALLRLLKNHGNVSEITLKNSPPDDEQRFDQNGQVGKVRDELLDARLELHCSHHTHFEAEVTQSAAQIVVDSDGLRLQQLAMGQQHSQFLTAQRLHMHRTVKPRPHHLRHTARIVTVGLVDLRSYSCAPPCGPAMLVTHDPTATLAVHCGNGFDAGFSPTKVLV